VTGRQTPEGLDGELAFHRRHHGVLWGVGVQWFCRLLGRDVDIGGWGATHPPALDVPAPIVGNDGEPWIETPFPGEIRKGPPRSGKGILGHILCFLVIVQPPEAEAVDPGVITRIELAECRRVPGLAPLYEYPITVEVDVVM
jgi:hypothetical protein